jgi:triacylglycerol lipase
MRLLFRPVLSGVLCAALAVACGSTGQQTSTTVSGSGGSSVINGGGGEGAGLVTVTTSSVSTGGAGGQGGNPGLGPPYPFVLAHGFFGFEKFAGLDFETYFYGVKDHLASKGEIVDTPAVDPFNDSDYRGQQLLNRVLDFLQKTGAAKVNIIGHSQGGLDARVVANLRPDLVASVVTVATPHHGTPVADVVMKVVSDPNAQQIIDALTNLVGGALYDQVGNRTSLTKAFELFSQPGITAFNAAHPDEPGIFYASVAGRSALRGVDGDCTANFAMPFIKPWESTLDPINPLFVATELVFGTKTNDGLVRAMDAQWGEFWGCVPADHLDEIGQILGQSPGLGNKWSHKDFYWQLVSYLRAQGF